MSKRTFVFFIAIGLILLLGMVSATNCCKVTMGGATCQNVEQADCASEFNTAECQDACSIGCCVYNGGVTCTPQSPKFECDVNGHGEWNSDTTCESISMCVEGCCDLGDNVLPQFTTEQNCKIASAMAGVTPSMNYNINEGTCILGGTTPNNVAEYTGTLGACVTVNNNEANDCKMTAKSGCTGNDEFHLGDLCTNPDLGTSHVPTQNTKCITDQTNRRGKIYYLDSEGEIMNIYDAERYNDDDYWERLIPETNLGICDVDRDGAEDCGNCDINAGSICGTDAEAGVDSTYGNYACRTLDCPNAPVQVNYLGQAIKNASKQNGETWCIYDSAVGVEIGPYEGDTLLSTDPPGSLHWLASCVNGKVEYELCGDKRNSICVESNITDPNTETDYSIAMCEENPYLTCLSYNSDNETDMKERCNNNSLCQVIDIDVDKYFKFSECVGKNPVGFTLRNATNEEEKLADSICHIGNVTCTVVKVTDSYGHVTRYNTDCKTAEFPEKMNNLCASLGDCGTYINYIGDGSQNIELKGGPADTSVVTFEDYEKFRDSIVDKIMKDSDLDRITKELSDILANAAVDDPNAGAPSIGHRTYIEKALSNYKDIQKSLRNNLGSTGNVINYVFTFVPIIPVAALVGALIQDIAGWGDSDTEKITFTCQPWQAPTGGDNCGLCNDDPLGRPCTKYKCESLGDACYFINGDTEKPECIAEEKDTRNPLITQGQVTTSGFAFGDNLDSHAPGVSVVATTPDEAGYRCVNKNGQINFTLNTDEYARCQYMFVDPKNEHILNFNSMSGYSPEEGSRFTLNHTFIINTADLNLDNRISWDRNDALRVDYYGMRMFLVCIDMWGNPPQIIEPYQIDFCMSSLDKDPVDFTSSDLSFNPPKGTSLKFNTTTQSLIMNLPEPARCSYSANSEMPYEYMENKMSCSMPFEDDEDDSFAPTARVCVTTLSNLTAGENKIYIRCNDSVGNPNEQSYEYNIFVTEDELEIDSVDVSIDYDEDTYTPNSDGKILLGNTPPSFGVDLKLKVGTSGGADNGESICDVNINGEEKHFYEENTSNKEQIIPGQKAGQYTLTITCKDSVGNSATNKTSFVLDLDNTAPGIIRIFREGSNLKFLTNEDATCYYNIDANTNCLFSKDDNSTSIIKIGTGFTDEHSTSWVTGRTYYVKCYDKWGNAPNSCNTIIKTNNIKVKAPKSITFK